MQLQTKRFLLRDFTLEDLPAFVNYHCDPRSVQYYQAHESTREHAQSLVATFRKWAQAQPRENFQLAVFRRLNPAEMIGCVGLRTAGLAEKQAEFGIELAPQHWGLAGYAIEIANAMFEYGFGQLNLDTITGRTAAENTRIKKLAVWYGAEILPAESDRARGLGWQLTRQQWLCPNEIFPTRALHSRSRFLARRRT